ncbi:MAG TPA: DUF2116 family Zn-ribbon domain-containing protein [Methanothermococcus okinawensis]|uniref:DUF2116 family Zn-ribbon domain-containing protein n=1 Tax=Methanothermococcus okinawensis TaxID=155863 RepID=A0A832ZJQ2_9EURY|nr:DUF2116 family Zn-ribbon domain-containing protein [Methanococcaceae archaeon]HIP84412.1 DUF2116 family Zn-ribbon domain-containing protein [Methanothermococcus okinawensis]HIP91113.1 DUF2116 family Zn-ribbon domain-containing protein [Methanothermococcus okinawensis]
MERHRHCLNCGISIPVGETFCSERCKEEYIKKRKRMLRIQLIVLFVIFLVLLIILGLKTGVI